MIYYPKTYGTCTGANRAIEMAYKLKSEFNDKNVYIYKEVLHNDYIINDLKRNGINIVYNLDEVSENDILILRAHGESKSVYEDIKRRNITCYDATCVNVKRVHDLVSEKYNNGFNIIIVGKKDHPEVIGTNGWCDNTAIIIENEEDYKQLNKNNKYYIVCQTTISYDKLHNLLQYLNSNKFDYSYDNTICNYQKLIQDSSVDLAKMMDIMIVIGGKESSNTKVLFNEVSKKCKSYFFSDIKEFYSFLKTFKIKKDIKIGFTGGASTPKVQIYEFAHLYEFYSYYLEQKTNIERELIKINKSLINDSDNPIIKDAINKFIKMNYDGKCLRGTLINLGYNTSKNDNYSIPLAGAYETFETSILVHDDIIDSSNIRRGKKTIHEEYINDFKFNNYIDNTPTSLALCLGDYGFFITNELINKKYKKDSNLPKILSHYNNIVIDTIKGEILDVYLPYVEKNDKNHELSHNDIMEIYRLKTAKYTITGPFTLGMILAHKNQKDIENAELALEPLGVAFQIKDDILGIFSKSDVLGKSVYSDIKEFKQTYLYSYIKINKPEYYEKLLEFYGKDIDEIEHKSFEEILINSGALSAAIDKMNELFFIAKHNITNLNINDNVKNILRGLITYLELREK